MKKFQQNLFVVLAVALCALCAYQWLQQSQQRNAIDTLNHLVFQKNSDIQYATNSIATLNKQIEQMDATFTAVKADDATNAALALSQKAEITRLTTNGKVKIAAISPDGRYVAYVTAEAVLRGRQTLWVRQVGTGSDVQIVSARRRGLWRADFLP